ncbi:MAG: hypothetical protein CMJ48_04450 [Planctomycetaceae bacterium]|nr:hypothetical protein [Planctomycetaceae bacterium]
MTPFWTTPRSNFVLRFLLAMLLTIATTSLHAMKKPSAPENADTPPGAKASTSPLKLTLTLPRDGARLSALIRGTATLKAHLTNTSDQDLMLWPLLTVNLQDAKGKPVTKTRNIGRYGLRTTNSIIEGVAFAKVEAGKTHTIDINLKQYVGGDDVISGWHLPAPGKYRFQLHYKYDAAYARKAYGRGCKNLDDPAQPWNQALEVELKKTVEINVTR